MKISPAKFPDKTPGENKEYSVDWSRAIPDDEISTAQWSATPSGLTFSGQSQETQKASAKIAGGTDGTDYCVSCKIATTTSGEDLEVVVPLKVTVGC